MLAEDKRDGTSLDTNGVAPQENSTNAEAMLRKRIRAAGSDLRGIFKDFDRTGRGVLSPADLQL